MNLKNGDYYWIRGERIPYEYHKDWQPARYEGNGKWGVIGSDHVLDLGEIEIGPEDAEAIEWAQGNRARKTEL
jgi:hypothetical protein